MLGENSTGKKAGEPGEVFIHGIKANAGPEEISRIIGDVFLKASGNLSWLSRGDRVLLKPALNSNDPYPATTHPLALHAVAGILKEKGADVIVGDQSGVEYVVMNQSGVIKGSSGKNYQKSGMGKGSKLEFVAFEDEDWEGGFYKYNSKSAVSWPHGFHISKWIKDVDHVINLPRLSTHMQSGVTLGFKNMVGCLREDSRLDFHANGPFYFYIKWCARKAGLKTVDDGLNAYYEKITEIELSMKDKLRLTLFSAAEAQVTFGPNKYVIRIGKGGILAAYRVKPDTGLVIAGADPVAAEAAALAFLTLLYRQAPCFKRLLQKISLFFNSRAKEPGKQDIWDNPFIKHGIKIGLGSGQVKMVYIDTPGDLQEQLNGLLKR